MRIASWRDARNEGLFFAGHRGVLASLRDRASKVRFSHACSRIRQNSDRVADRPNSGEFGYRRDFPAFHTLETLSLRDEPQAANPKSLTNVRSFDNDASLSVIANRRDVQRFDEWQCSGSWCRQLSDGQVSNAVEVLKISRRWQVGNALHAMPPDVWRGRELLLDEKDELSGGDGFSDSFIHRDCVADDQFGSRVLLSGGLQ